MAKYLRVVSAVLLVSAAFVLYTRPVDAATWTSIMVYQEKQPNKEGKSEETYKLFLKSGSTSPQLLTTFSSVYSPQYRLSYSNKTLAINLKTKILFVDLRTKKTQELLTASDGMYFSNGAPPSAGVAISPDDKKVVAVEYKGTTTSDETMGARYSYQYSVKQVVVATGEATVLKTGNAPIYYIPRFYRKDGTILFMSSGSRISLFDPTTGDFVGVKQQPTGLFSSDGTAVTKTRGTAWRCEDAKKITYLIIDYKRGRTIKPIPTTGWNVRPIAVAPSKTKMLFSASVPACGSEEKPSETKFFVGDATAGTVTETSDYLIWMRDFGGWYIDARESYVAGKGYMIVVKGVPAVVSANPLVVAAQFWQKGGTGSTKPNEQVAERKKTSPGVY